MQGDNIRLIPHTLLHLRALLKGSAAYEQQFGSRVADGVRDFLAGPEVSQSFLERLNSSTGSDPWRDGFAVLHLADDLVIGLCSYGGPPVGGAVEISYGIVPAYRGRGYATEAAQILIARAVVSGHVNTLQAHTLPEHNASTKVLEKCGFKLVGEVMHPEDGLIWRWELPAMESTASRPTA
ncbi:MAG: [ribosomal protein S5]-alanine N-acetyltransferase [Verrucomicrobiota bacterium]|jgi:RimJ/RimL family protein N-acetyltransferase